MPRDSGVVYEDVCADSTEFFFDCVEEAFNSGEAGMVEELGEDAGGGVDGFDGVGGRLESFSIGAHRDKEGRGASMGELFSNTLRTQVSANELLKGSEGDLCSRHALYPVAMDSPCQSPH